MTTETGAPERTAEWFADERGAHRRLKVSWRPEHRLVVLSVWREDECAATIRLSVAEATRLIASLVNTLGDAARAGLGRRSRHRG